MLDGLITIEAKQPDADGKQHFEVKLNGGHEVYKGHFPGNPITPGVCNIYILKRCAESVVGDGLVIANIKQCKFTHLLSPKEYGSIEVTLSITPTPEGGYSLYGELQKGDVKFMMLKGEAIKAEKMTAEQV